MSSPAPIRVFIVDDQDLVRVGFEMILRATPDLRVVGSVGDGQAALDALRQPAHRADIVLMDIRMPGLDGVETTLGLADGSPGPG